MDFYLTPPQLYCRGKTSIDLKNKGGVQDDLDDLHRAREHAVGHFKLCDNIDIFGELWPPPGVVPRIVFNLL
jgi:hypothetical protein